MFHTFLIDELKSDYINFKSLNRITSINQYRPCIISSTMYRDTYQIAVKMCRYTPTP